MQAFTRLSLIENNTYIEKHAKWRLYLFVCSILWSTSFYVELYFKWQYISWMSSKLYHTWVISVDVVKITWLYLLNWFVLWAYKRLWSYYIFIIHFCLLFMLAQNKGPYTLTFKLNLSIMQSCTTSTFLSFLSMIARQLKSSMM